MLTFKYASWNDGAVPKNLTQQKGRFVAAKDFWSGAHHRVPRSVTNPFDLF